MSASAQLFFRPDLLSQDYALFTRRTSRGIAILLLYVEDMIISGDNALAISHLKQHLLLLRCLILVLFATLEVASASRRLAGIMCVS